MLNVRKESVSVITKVPFTRFLQTFTHGNFTHAYKNLHIETIHKYKVLYKTL